MKKIVMVDQDGVVTDKNYQATKDIKEFLRGLLLSGILIVPNSDTPVARLSYNFEVMLGFKPNVIIGEKGAVVKMGWNTYFLSNVQGSRKFISELVSLFRSEGALIAVGDSATWIRENKKFEPNSDLLIIDALRQQSIGFYLRTSDFDGFAQVNKKWAEKGEGLMVGLNLPPELDDFDYNSKYGVFISNAKNINKTDGFRFLKLKFPGHLFFMIGDSDADIIEDDSVIHCAVDNGIKLLKCRASYVSGRQFTEGLEDCLNWIAHY